MILTSLTREQKAIRHALFSAAVKSGYQFGLFQIGESFDETIHNVEKTLDECFCPDDEDGKAVLSLPIAKYDEHNKRMIRTNTQLFFALTPEAKKEFATIVINP